MAFLRIPRGWELPEREATAEEVALGRRDFLRLATQGAVGAALLGCAARSDAGPPPAASALSAGARRNPRFLLDRPITDEQVAATYNNYYEFTEDKEGVAALAQRLTVSPWTIEIAGEVARPRTYDVRDLIKLVALEERLYRHRCVEAWAMAVPWIGFPLKALVALAAPRSSARYVRFVSFQRPAEAPGQSKAWYPWPYFEALTMAEATHELALVATGMYGHDLRKQHGAPLRLVVPWKYGYKSIKGIVRVELTATRPPTFWNQLAPDEYGFESNVDPTKPHPRWSQATERMLGTNERRPTLPLNGYGPFVASLYRG